MPETNIVRTQKAAAAALGVSLRQFCRWLKESWFPADARNGADYDIAAIVTARDAMGRAGSEQSDQSKQLKLDIDNQNLRLKRINADKAERLELEAQGNILPRDEYTLAATEAITITRDRIMTIPRELCRFVPKKYHRRLIEEGNKEVRKILNEFARLIERGPAD